VREGVRAPLAAESKGRQNENFKFKKKLTCSSLQILNYYVEYNEIQPKKCEFLKVHIFC
jgi:hypothetical protein